MKITGKLASAALGALALAAMSNGAFAQQQTIMPASGTLAISDGAAVGTPGSLGAAAGTVPAPEQIVGRQEVAMPASGTVAISDGAAVGTAGSLGATAAKTMTAQE